MPLNKFTMSSLVCTPKVSNERQVTLVNSKTPIIRAQIML